MLQWLLDSGATIASEIKGETKRVVENDVQADSRSWGNYDNSTGDAIDNSGILQQTGTSEYWKANNIYDIAGNAHEWTQEKYSTGANRADRGGSCYKDGDGSPAAIHFYNDEASTNINVRFQSKFLCIVV